MTVKAAKTLTRIIQNAIRQGLMDAHVCVPARIETYDPGKQKASVKPLLKKAYADGGETEMAVITDVPVQWPSGDGGKAYLHFPLEPGDPGKLIFADRNLTAWLLGDGRIAMPADGRIHDIKDAVFEPGLRPFGAPLSNTSASNAVLQHDRMRIEMDPSGKISVSGASEELLTIIDSLIDHLIAARVATGMGAMPFYHTTIADLTSDKARLETIKRV